MVGLTTQLLCSKRRSRLGVVGFFILASTLGCAQRGPAQAVAPTAAPSSLETPPTDSAASEPPPPPADFSELYQQLVDDVHEYEDGLGLLRDGDELGGEERVASAMEGMAAAFEVCRSSEGCDVNRFWDGLERLLGAQANALKLQANELLELEAAAQQREDEEQGTEPLTTIIEPSIPEVQRTVALLRGTELRELITLNAQVKAALDDWLTWNRPLLMQSYENYLYLRSQIAPVYDEAGLPEALLFGMIATETGGRVHSTSRAGARGLLQFMRYTGRKYGLREVDGFDTRFDPVEATRANVAYLNDLFGMMNNDLEKALASYNGGEGRLKRIERRVGADISLWDSRFYYQLPKETREYVPRIFAAAWLFLHPDEYNLEWPLLETETVELELAREASLSELTICLGQHDNDRGWFRTLRNLNPRLQPRDRVPPGQPLTVPRKLVPVYQERCVEGELLDRAEALHAANYPDESELISYTVRRGDTLGKIASRHRCVSVRELASLNRVQAPRYVISVGQVLKIPNCG